MQLLAISMDAAAIGEPNQSGIVIAGFGEKDIYPQCENHNVSAILAGHTIKHPLSTGVIDSNNSALIMSFAQSNEVSTFMEGIGPIMAEFLKGKFYSIMVSALPKVICDAVCKEIAVSGGDVSKIQNITEQMCKGACDEALNQLDEIKHKHYSDPVIQATQSLNKAELATMAETLVNLVSFRKQVTMEAETVGGPIDVAVITKGDGFIWIKKKSYFKTELNHEVDPVFWTVA
jgi:hypothetical protein